MTADKVKKYLYSLTSHITFLYNGKDCGVDPLFKDKYDVWCGEENTTLESIDDVMTKPLFDGFSLSDICQSVQIEY